MDIREAIDMIVAGADPRAVLSERGGTLVAYYHGTQPEVPVTLPSAPSASPVPDPHAGSKQERGALGKTPVTSTEIDDGLDSGDVHAPLSEGETILDAAYEDYVEQYVREVRNERLGPVSVGPMLSESAFRTILRILNTLERTQRRPDLALKFKRQILCPV